MRLLDSHNGPDRVGLSALCCVPAVLPASPTSPCDPMLLALPNLCFSLSKQAPPRLPQQQPRPDRVPCLMQSKRISLATGGAAIPGAVPDTMDALLDTQELAAQQAVALAEKFATNVAPAVVPEAAGRARLADIQADLALCRLTFLSAHSALLALSNGRLLQLSLQVWLRPRTLCGGIALVDVDIATCMTNVMAALSPPVAPRSRRQACLACWPPDILLLIRL